MGAAASTPQQRANALGRAPVDVFAALYRHLKENRTRMLELFKELDRDQTAFLEKREISTLVQRIVPTASNAQIKYVRTVLDFNTDGKLSYQELHQVRRHSATSFHVVAFDKYANDSPQLTHNKNLPPRPAHLRQKNHL